MAPERLGRDTPHETVAPLQRSEMVMISPTQKHRQHLGLHGDGTHAPTDPSPTTAVDGVVFCPWAGYHGNLSPVWYESLNALPLAGPLCGPAPAAQTCPRTTAAYPTALHVVSR
jgi:hypothetical protein